VRPTVTFPQGWTVFTALDGKAESGSGKTVTWAETDYETLVDSPIFAGLYTARHDLGHDVLDLVADKPELLAIKPENLQAYRNLADEAVGAFGARHFDHYDFLLALTDRMGGIGLEHHRSSENQQEPKSLTDWAGYDWDRNVIAHEFSHSWDGKYRRSAKLWTPDYRQPMQDNLLWVYEGQTQFWGLVLAARSGVQSKDMVLGSLANYAGTFTPDGGPRLALGGRHHDGSHLRRAQAQALRLAHPQRGLLHRRRAGVAGSRPDHPRWHRRQEGPGRFRQGLLRRARWRLGRADL
jgi:predicted metalloprotease with PDZ domain